MQEITNLDEKKIMAAHLLVQGLEKREIAKDVGVSHTTLYKWLKDEEFLAEINTIKRELKTQGLNMMTGKLNRAVKEYWDLVQTTDNDRVKAEGYQYFINHNLGKPTTKLDIDTGMKPEQDLDHDILEQEFQDFEDE